MSKDLKRIQQHARELARSGKFRRLTGGHPRFVAMYEDGSTDVFAVPECTLDQGPGKI